MTRPVSGLVIVTAASARTLRRHFHDEYGMGVMETGAHLSASGRGQVQAEPGDVITVNPGEVHDGAPVGGTLRRWRMIYFDPCLVQPMW
ncbi:MAG TPA: AraC family ligand binding domain-containing protein, partial [Sphingomonas sp.]|nr:AraC family ligand binding domain-containing protein [Sphingomonas sp.]